MEWNYTDYDKAYFQVDIENGKKYRIKKEWVSEMQKDLDISEFEAIEMWLDDNEILEPSQEQADLMEKAKENKSNKVVKASSTEPKKKTQRERVVKENPTKELIISTLAKALEPLQVDNLVIENKGKLITFDYNGESFKVDLVQKRKKKGEN